MRESVCVRVCETFLGEVDAKERAEQKTVRPELLCFSGTNELLAVHAGFAAADLLAVR